VERCGRDDTVLKLMPPLDIPESELAEGLEILAGALEVCLAEQRRDKLGA
jgi:4-aminobutyrate aminotransferase-like enzyme